MEVVMLTQDINTLFSSLGCPIGDEYIIGDDCKETLEEILGRLNNEDKHVRGFRRLIANSQVLKKDLLPLFYNVKNDFKVLDLIIGILENLMIPVECLLPIDIMIKEDAGRSTICQLNWLLTACKEAFLNPSTTKCVIEYIKLIIKKDQPVTAEGVHSVSSCLQLLRNLLHIPEVRGGAPGGGASHQNQIIWNLFTQQFDRVLIHLMTDSHRAVCSVTVVQIISLLFKDQHSNTIYKLLNSWRDTALSESSEDDESNTSPQDRGSGDSSSSMATSDRTSDSSDSDHKRQKQNKMEVDKKIHNHPYAKQGKQSRMPELFTIGVGRKAQVAMRNKHGYKTPHHVAPKHRHTETYSPDTKMGRICRGSESGLGSETSCNSSIVKMVCDSTETSECGYVSLNQETISTSSNEDKEPARFAKKKPVHQKSLHLIQKVCYNGKPLLSPQARQDLCRIKLMKRSKTTTMSIKTFLNHTPNEEDVSQLLKEFTVDFLLKGYRHLVAHIKGAVIFSADTYLDTSHFTWLVMYFLRFAALLELDLELIRPVLSYDLVAYLIYEGVKLSEELEVNKLHVGEDLTKTLRKQYLVVVSLKEILYTLDCYKKVGHLSNSDCKYLRQLREKLSCSKDLKYLFVLLLRLFDPMVQSHQYLQDLVVANHYLLVMMEQCPLTSKADITQHIKQFANEDIMAQYGTLLTCYENNGKMVNDCIFTMMHHVNGDLESVSVLFQPLILRSFTRILETKFEIRDEWLDLVEYVVQKCLKTNLNKCVPLITLNKDEDVEMTSQTTLVEHHITVEWSREDKESLCWYFAQSVDVADPIGHISKMYNERSGQTKNRIEIIEHLLEQGLIAEEEHKSLLEKEPCSMKSETKSSNNYSEMDILEGIQVIADYLNGENCGFFIKWLQSCLLEVCYARLVCNQSKPQSDCAEPIAYFYTKLGQPVPLVTWTQDLWRVMQLEPSIWLLSALNFQLPTRAGQAKIFARIPAEWTPDHLYVAALLLGPLDSSNMKFDPSSLKVIQHSRQPIETEPPPVTENTLKGNNSSLFGFFLGSSSATDWIQKVKQLKPVSKVQPLEDKHEWMSTISGDEQDWDLTSLCVSDEGARHDPEYSGAMRPPPHQTSVQYLHNPTH